MFCFADDYFHIDSVMDIKLEFRTADMNGILVSLPLRREIGRAHV